MSAWKQWQNAIGTPDEDIAYQEYRDECNRADAEWEEEQRKLLCEEEEDEEDEEEEDE